MARRDERRRGPNWGKWPPGSDKVPDSSQEVLIDGIGRRYILTVAGPLYLDSTDAPIPSKPNTKK